MKFDLIFTYAESDQDWFETEIPDTYLKTKEKFTEYVTSQLTINEADELVKISCCAIGAKKEDLPDWFLDCNGKLYF